MFSRFEAIARAAACGVPTVLATGKTRGPWHANAVAPKIPIPMPGVFIQGLLTTDADGTVLESVTLPPAIALDHHVRDLVAALVRRKPAIALQAFATPPNEIAFLAFTRVDDPVLAMPAKRTGHNP